MALRYRMAVRHRVRAPLPPAELQQAHYFDALLGRQRAELDELLDHLHAELSHLDRIGDVSESRTKRRLIKALEAEVRSIDRMRKALRLRLADQPDIDL